MNWQNRWESSSAPPCSGSLHTQRFRHHKRFLPERSLCPRLPPSSGGNLHNPAAPA